MSRVIIYIAFLLSLYRVLGPDVDLENLTKAQLITAGFTLTFAFTADLMVQAKTTGKNLFLIRVLLIFLSVLPLIYLSLLAINEVSNILVAPFIYLSS